jgi:hypothetical protein
MKSANDYEAILRQVKGLDLIHQLRLIQDLMVITQQQGRAGSQRSILELQGLGKEVWEGIDADKYVDQERASWDG